MAVIEQEKDEKKGYGEEQPASAPTITPAYTAPNAQQKTGTGRFTNIQKYLGANVGAGQQLGQQIGQKAEKEAEQVRKGIESARTQFGQQYQPEQQRLSGASQFVQQSLAAPENLSPEQIKQYQQLTSGQYAAPTLNLNEVQQRAQGLQQGAQMGKTESGRYDLLRQTFGSPSYTQGQRRLDQLFLQTQNPQALQNRLTQTAAGAGQQVSGAQTELGGQLEALKQLAGSAQTEAQTGAQSAQESQLAAGQTKAEQLTGEQRGLYDTLRKALSGGQISQEEFTGAQQRLGNLPSEFQGALNINQIDPTLLLGTTPEAVNLGEALGQEGVARLGALQQLSGTPIAGFPTQGQAYNPAEFLNPERLTPLRQAGQLELQGSLTRAKGESEQKINNVANTLNSIGGGGMKAFDYLFAAIPSEEREAIKSMVPRDQWGNRQAILDAYKNKKSSELTQQTSQIQAPYQRTLEDILKQATNPQYQNLGLEQLPTVS